MANRREFLRCAPVAAAWGSIQASEQAFGFQAEKSKLKITGLRLVNTRPKRALSKYKVPPAGAGEEVYRAWDEAHQITRGPEGVYTRPLDRPGFGWDVIADPV